MRILLIIKRFNYGGAENHVCELANKLVELGHNVWIVSKNGKQVNKLDLSVNHIKLGFKDLFIPVDVIRIIRLIRREKIDIIHTHQRLAIVIGCLSSLFIRIPVIATIHGRIRYDLRSRFVRHKLHRIIVISANSMRGIQKCSILRHKALLIPNGVADIVTKSNGCNTFKLVYASRLNNSHGKVIELLLEKVMPYLLQAYPLIELEVVGEGNYFDKLFKMSDKINLMAGRTAVKLLGYRANIFSIISNSKLVLGVGRVALESLANGIPVLSLHAAHLGAPVSTENFEYLSANNFVAVDNSPPCPHKLLTKIMEVIDNYSFFKSEAKELQNIVLVKYDLNYFVNQIIAEYKTCQKILLKRTFFSQKMTEAIAKDWLMNLKISATK